MVNKTELKALEWLKKQGYKESEIIQNLNKTPDFICGDGKRYEVKFLYKDKLIFYPTQIENLKGSDIILVFNREKLLTKFLWKERKKSMFRIYIPKDLEKTTIQIEDKTLQRLKEEKITKRESYDEVVNRLLDLIGVEKSAKTKKQRTSFK